MQAFEWSLVLFFYRWNKVYTILRTKERGNIDVHNHTCISKIKKYKHADYNSHVQVQISKIVIVDSKIKSPPELCQQTVYTYTR